MSNTTTATTGDPDTQVQNSATNDPSTMLFSKNWIKPGFASEWMHAGKQYSVVHADFFRDPDLSPRDLERKIVIGHLLRVQTPSTASSFYKPSATSLIKGSDTKRIKISTPAAGAYSIMLVCADAMNLPQTFCLIFNSKQDYQSMYGFHSLAERVSLGDKIAFLEPEAADDQVGYTTVIRNPRRAFALLPVLNIYPCKPAAVSSNPGQEFGWYNVAKSIDIFSPRFLNRGKLVPCYGSTCDRQYSTCKGCFGKSNALIKPLVLSIGIEVQNEPVYARSMNRRSATFTDFRSWKFTQLFFEDCDKISNLPTSELDSIDLTDPLRDMVDIVNLNGGWTIVGWHRLGERTDAEGTELVSSTSTKGHLVSVTPTNIAVLDMPAFKSMRIKPPTSYSETNNTST